jgi:hypothetical protein
MTEHHLTFHTRLPVTEEQEPALQGNATLFGKLERSLFAAHAAGETLTKLKSDYLRQFGITARQFNAARFTTEGKIAAAKECRQRHLQQLRQRIEKLATKLPRIRDGRKRKQQQCRLQRLQSKQAGLERDIQERRLRLCFGSKKLFREQLQVNSPAEQAAWRQQWQSARNNQFFCIGSKDETSGNQTCVATIADDDSLTLRLRLPNTLAQHGKYLHFTNIRFAYGHNDILQALRAGGQAIHYRFVKDQKGWRLLLTLTIPEPKWISDNRLGVVLVSTSMSTT